MDNGSQTPSRLPLALLVVAALGGPAAAAFKFNKQIWDHPWQTIAIAITYEAVIFAVGFVTKIWERLQSRWVDGLADWLDGRVRVLLSNYEQRYLKQLVFKHRTFDVKGLTTQSVHALEVEQVFVELAVAPQTPHLSSADPIAPVALETEGPRTIWDYIKAETIGSHNLAILGAPGSGKTTLLKHVTLTMAIKNHRASFKAIPILLFLRDHAESINANPDLSLAQVMRDNLTKMGCSPPAGWLERRLEKGKFLVMMDGIDEVADADTRKRVVNWIDRQLENNGNNRFLVTSRPFGYRDNPLSGVTVVVVRPFNSDQVRRFVHNWYLANEIMSAQKSDAGVQMAAEEGADDLLRRLQSVAALSELAVNPLLLTMITTVHRYRSSLPGRRVELYAEICDVFLGKRQQARGLSFDLTPAQKKHVLAPLAYQMMRDRRREVDVTDAVKAISGSLQKVSPQSSGEEFLKMVENSSGLLLERDIGVYSFAHLTLQEYLAASYIQANQLENDLIQQLGDSWWHETTRLYAAQADATAVIGACIVGGSPSVPLLTLAIECMEEAREIQPSIRAQIENILNQGVEDSDPTRRMITAQAKLALRQRKMVRIDEDVYIDASCVSAGEYQLFLDECKQRSEYRQPDHWQECRFPAGLGTRPATGVRSSDAIAFCLWLSNRDQEGWVYQLIDLREIGSVDKFGDSDGTGYWHLSETGVRCSRISDPKAALTCDTIFAKIDSALKLLRTRVEITDDDLDQIVNKASLLSQKKSQAESDFELKQLANALDGAIALAASTAMESTRNHDQVLASARSRVSGLLDGPRVLDIDRDLTLVDEICQDIDRALFRGRTEDHVLTRALDLACLIFKIVNARRDRCADKSLILRSVGNAFFILAFLFLSAGSGETSRVQRKREHMVKCCLEIFFDVAVLSERCETNILAFEGIRITKSRKGRRSA